MDDFTLVLPQGPWPWTKMRYQIYESSLWTTPVNPSPQNWRHWSANPFAGNRGVATLRFLERSKVDLLCIKWKLCPKHCLFHSTKNWTARSCSKDIIFFHEVSINKCTKITFYHLSFSYIWHAEITQNRDNFENFVKKSGFPRIYIKSKCLGILRYCFYFHSTTPCLEVDQFLKVHFRLFFFLAR